jgi:hypothetical protein
MPPTTRQRGESRASNRRIISGPAKGGSGDLPSMRLCMDPSLVGWMQKQSINEPVSTPKPVSRQVKAGKYQWRSSSADKFTG